MSDKDHLNIELRGELAGILALAMDRKKPGDLSAAGHAQQIKMVAGTRNNLYRTQIYLPYSRPITAATPVRIR
jgi:hypothetical protein